MAIKANASITLSTVVDVKATYRYYLLQSSTLTKPSKPTTYPPASTWTDTEPTYTEGSTNSLYFVDCTVFCDDTFSYSEVSLSSSYEAAKVAYNKAQNAQNTADSANEKIDSTAEEINRTMTEQNTSIIRSCEEILFTALESYIETSNYEEFKSTAETQLKVLADSLAIQVSELSQRITEVNGDLQTKFEQVTTYFTFDVDGLTIGKVDNPYKVIIDNERYSMTVNGVEVLWMDATTGEVHTPKLTITERFTLLGYVIDMDDDGNVNCEYAGGDV